MRSGAPGCRSARATLASALRWSAPAPSGASSRKRRSTGWPSSDSNSIGLSRRAISPNIRESPGSLPCGIAMPSPMPVEPRRSRCRSVSKIARSSRPVRRAACAASSCSAAFLLGGRRCGTTASGVRRSANAMAMSLDGRQAGAQGASGRRFRRNARLGPRWRSSGGARRRVYPADGAVAPSVDHVHASRSGMVEHHDRRSGEIELEHRVAHRQAVDRTGGLGDHHRVELVLLDLVARGGEDRIGALGAAVGTLLGLAVLEAALVAPQPLLDPLRGLVEAQIGVGRGARGLERDAGGEVEDAFGAKPRPVLRDGHVARIVAVEILAEGAPDAALDLGPQRLADVEVLSGYAQTHRVPPTLAALASRAPAGLVSGPRGVGATAGRL